MFWFSYAAKSGKALRERWSIDGWTYSRRISCGEIVSINSKFSFILSNLFKSIGNNIRSLISDELNFIWMMINKENKITFVKSKSTEYLILSNRFSILRLSVSFQSVLPRGKRVTWDVFFENLQIISLWSSGMIIPLEFVSFKSMIIFLQLMSPQSILVWKIIQFDWNW